MAAITGLEQHMLKTLRQIYQYMEITDVNDFGPGDGDRFKLARDLAAPFVMFSDLEVENRHMAAREKLTDEIATVLYDAEEKGLAGFHGMVIPMLAEKIMRRLVGHK